MKNIVEYLQKEYLIEKLYELLNTKDSINIPLSLSEVSELYKNAIFINKDNFEFQGEMRIYDTDGYILMDVSPPFIDEYSSEDFLNDNNLLNKLKEKIKIIEDSNILILFEE